MKLLLVNLVLATSFVTVAAQAAEVVGCPMPDGSVQQVAVPSDATVQSVSSILSSQQASQQRSDAILKVYSAAASDLCPTAVQEYTKEKMTVSLDDCTKALSSQEMLEAIQDSKPVSGAASVACQIGTELKLELTIGDGFGFGDFDNQ